MGEWTRGLDEVGAADVALGGGEAANLVWTPLSAIGGGLVTEVAEALARAQPG